MSAPSAADIVSLDDSILVTGASGFIGSRVVAYLRDRGFRKIRCLVRSAGNSAKLQPAGQDGSVLEICEGNLLSKADCEAITRDAAVIYHLAAGTGGKSYSDAYLNSVVTTRNLLDAVVKHKRLKRFVNISSFSVYTNRDKPTGKILDESCPIELQSDTRPDAYCYGKVKQDELVLRYAREHDLQCVFIRPGVVFGPGKHSISGRIGIDSFGIFLNFAGGNPIPFTYVENCAEAIGLAGLVPGVEGEVFNVVDDDLPSGSHFLRQYKRQVRSFRSLYVPHVGSYLLCWAWETFARWSQGQVPAAYTRKEWSAFWKPTRYSNAKAKRLLGWNPRVPMREGLLRYYTSCREKLRRA